MLKIKEYLYKRLRTSFSKSGDDILLGQLLKRFKQGNYVDIGAYHPVFGSHTYYFYLRGWRGLCIEPNFKYKDSWGHHRSEDVFVNKGIGRNKELRDYYILESDERNTFSKDYIKHFSLSNQASTLYKVEMIPLKELLEDNDYINKPIHFMSIDCEGFEMEVLESNDWFKFRPIYILLESHEVDLLADLKSPEVEFLSLNNYELIGKTMQGDFVGNLLFKDTLIELND